MTRLDVIRCTLSAHTPVLRGAHEGETFAAMALIFSGDPEDPELLFIERAKREGDPWSGQMAFPGGRVEESDRSVRETAQREVLGAKRHRQPRWPRWPRESVRPSG